VAAATARAMASGLLREAINDRPGISLDSYDRLFPAQDFLPVDSKGAHRFGDLVALQLHGASRVSGRTVFADPETWEPYDDQFAYLAEDTNVFDKHLYIHATRFETAESLRDGASIQAMLSELAGDRERNGLIADVLAGAYRRGRRSLALATRVEHVTAIKAALDAYGFPR
jgi:hypothetical protein